MKTTVAASSAGRELTINEKLTMFRQKKDESRKENDASVLNCSTSKKNGSAVLKSHSDGILKSKAVERVTSQVTVIKQSIQCAPNNNSLSIDKKLTRKQSSVCKRSTTQRTDQKQRMSTLGTRPPSPAELKIKLDEYIMLAENAGIKISRSFISAVPSETNMKDVESQVMYWLTWIRYEGKAEEWEFTNSLFARAKNAVTSLSGLQAIATAEQQYYAEHRNTSCTTTLESMSDLVSHQDSASQRDSEGNKLNDVRMVMGEDGFSQGHLSDPKTLRFSLDSSETSDSQPICLKSSSYAALNAMKSGSSRSSIAVKEGPPKVQVKYADFLKSTNRTDLSSMNNVIELPESNDHSNTAVRFMSSDSKSVNDRDMSESIVPFDTSIETIALADLSALTSGGAPKRRRSSRGRGRSPGGASLDVLLGLGCCGNGASDSEDEELDSNKRESSPTVHSELMVDDHVMHNGDLAPRVGDIPSRVTTLLISANINVPSNKKKRNLPMGKKRVTRVQVGVCDIFSDDEEEIVSSASAELSMVETMMDTTESEYFVDIKDAEIIESTVPRRSSTVRRSVVSFAEVSAFPSVEGSSLDGLDSDMMAVVGNTSSGGVRRSCRLSNASSSSSAKKARRQATPYAPRFARPNSGTSGSGKTPMDVMREDCGYGSYFNSMNSPDKPGADDSQFDLLASTPIIPDRRSSRFSDV